jgi:NitT/TauT family transport system substrate-binding protein
MKKFTILVLSLILVLALAAGALAAEKPIKIRWGYFPGTTQVTLHIAFDKGYFKGAGLDVEPVSFKSGLEMNEAFASDKIEVYSANPTAVIISRDKGIPLKIVASLAKNGSYIVTRKGVTINSAKDLLKYNVAVPGKANVQDVLLRLALMNEGLDPNAYKAQTFAYADTTAVLQSQKYDAVFSTEPFISIAERNGVIGQVVPLSTLGLEGHQCCVVAFKEEFIKKNPRIMEKVVQAIDKATEFYNKHPEESAVIVSRWTKADPEILKQVFKRHYFVSRIDYAAENWYAVYLGLMKKMGYVQNAKLSTDDIIAREFQLKGFYNKNWSPSPKLADNLGVKLPNPIKLASK